MTFQGPSRLIFYNSVNTDTKKREDHFACGRSIQEWSLPGVFCFSCECFHWLFFFFFLLFLFLLLFAPYHFFPYPNFPVSVHHSDPTFPGMVICLVWFPGALCRETSSSPPAVPSVCPQDPGASWGRPRVSHEFAC